MPQQVVYVRPKQYENDVLQDDCQVITRLIQKRMQAVPEIEPAVAFRDVRNQCRRLWDVDWGMMELVVQE